MKTLFRSLAGLVALMFLALIVLPRSGGNITARGEEITGEMMRLDSLIDQGNTIENGIRKFGPYMTLEQFETVRQIGLASIGSMRAILNELSGLDSTYAGMSAVEYRSHMRRVVGLRLAVARSFARAEVIIQAAILKRARLAGGRMT